MRAAAAQDAGQPQKDNTNDPPAPGEEGPLVQVDDDVEQARQERKSALDAVVEEVAVGPSVGW